VYGRGFSGMLAGFCRKGRGSASCYLKNDLEDGRKGLKLPEAVATMGEKSPRPGSPRDGSSPPKG